MRAIWVKAFIEEHAHGNSSTESDNFPSGVIFCQQFEEMKRRKYFNTKYTKESLLNSERTTPQEHI